MNHQDNLFQGKLRIVMDFQFYQELTVDERQPSKTYFFIQHLGGYNLSHYLDYLNILFSEGFYNYPFFILEYRDHH